jgi:hypothetical protein
MVSKGKYFPYVQRFVQLSCPISISSYLMSWKHILENKVEHKVLILQVLPIEVFLVECKVLNLVIQGLRCSRRRLVM